MLRLHIQEPLVTSNHCLVTMHCFQLNNIKSACADWTGMGGSHAPDFATGAAALAYINGLNTAGG